MPRRAGEKLAVVDSVCRPAGTCAYAACHSREVEVEGSITFSLTHRVWSGEKDPIEAQLVYIADLIATEQGARAGKARPVPLADLREVNGG